MTLRRLAALALGIGGLALVAGNAVFRSPLVAESSLMASLATHNALGMGRAATQAFLAQQPDKARTAALAALRSAPLDAVSLATVVLTERDADRATQQVQALAALGWRADAAQALLATLALQNGDATVYRQRLRALLRRQSPAEITNPILDQGLADPAMRHAAVAALASSTTASSVWAQEGRSPQALENLAQALAEMPRDDSLASRKRAVMLIDQLQVAGLHGEAYRLWRTLFGKPRAMAEVLADPMIERFGWVVPDDKPVVVALDGESAVAFTKHSPFAATVLTQALDPMADSVRLNVRYGKEQGRFDWQFRCTGRAPYPVEVKYPSQQLAVPEGCIAPTIEARMDSRTSEVTIAKLDVVS